MNTDFQRLMLDATRLTQSGDLQAATAAIQAALQAQSSSAAAQAQPAYAFVAEAPALRSDIVIDVEAREVASPLTGNPASDAEAGPATDQRAGKFIAGTSRGLEYKLYVPPQAGLQPLPLVVMLHGCTQDPDDFAAGTAMNEAAREQGCFVLYPAQSRRANPQRCWNWFKHTHQQRGRGEPAVLAGMTRDVMADHRIDPARVYVAGLSAGGAMAAILAETNPELFAAAGIHSGLAAGAARDLPTALGAMQSGQALATTRASGRPTIVFHGDADSTVHPGNAASVVGAAVKAGRATQVEEQRGSEGRGFTRHTHRSADGNVVAEHWTVHGAGHAWSGGSRSGTYADPSGPDATREMLRFFLEHPRA